MCPRRDGRGSQVEQQLPVDIDLRIDELDRVRQLDIKLGQ